MGVLKRAVLSLSRRKDKSIMLLAVVFITIAAVAGGISVRLAIINTDENLRRLMPPVVSIDFDNAEWRQNFNHLGSEYEMFQVTAEFAREVGTLPQVNKFNYSV